MMATVKELLDALAARRMTVSEVAVDFRQRNWAPRRSPTAAQAWGVEDADAPGDNDWSLVESDSRLSAAQLAVLGKAYDTAHARR